MVGAIGDETGEPVIVSARIVIAPTASRTTVFRITQWNPSLAIGT